MQLDEARVLVVDDEPALREIFAKWLSSMGCGEVRTAVDGQDAFELLQADSFHLLITDVRMPRMDGITLVRKMAECKRSLPSIIFVSGFGDVDEREMYGQGVEAFLSKPLRMEELLDVIRRALAERSDLWLVPGTVSPRQTIQIEAGGAAGLHIGRGGLSLRCEYPLALGKIGFEVAAEGLRGQGLVRWRSRTDQRAGIEFTYLEEAGRKQVLERIASEQPRCFIPG